MNNNTSAISPLDDLLERSNTHNENCRIPLQLHEILEQPAPKGWDQFHDPMWKPRDTPMFSTLLPYSVDDTYAYVREMQYPFPKTLMYIRGYAKDATIIFRLMTALAAIASLVLYIPKLHSDNVTTFTTFMGEISYSFIAASIAISSIVLYILSFAVMSVALNSTFKTQRNNGLSHRPTQHMVEIEERSVKDVFDLSIPAFDVFCYDTKHYNEFIELYITLAQSYAKACEITDNKAEETRTACKKILTDWLYTSSFRQDTAKKDRIEATQQYKQQQAEAGRNAARNNAERDIIARDFDSAYATALLEVFRQQQQQ